VDKSFLGHRQQVALNGASSQQSEVISSVPQGTVLGPLLFIYFFATVVNSQIWLYADDKLLFRQINSTEDSSALQRDVDAIVKSGKYLVCSPQDHKQKKIPHTLKQYQICKSKNATYLGVTI